MQKTWKQTICVCYGGACLSRVHYKGVGETRQSWLVFVRSYHELCVWQGWRVGGHYHVLQGVSGWVGRGKVMLVKEEEWSQNVVLNVGPLKSFNKGHSYHNNV